MADPLYSDYYKVKVAARCVLGSTSYACSGFELSFGINRFSSASIHLPVGRNAGGSQFNAISPAGSVMADLGPQTKVEVYATFTSSPSGRGAPSGSSLGFPDGKEFLVFTGFLKSPIFKRTANSVSVTIEAMGETAALAGGTPFAKGMVVTDFVNGGAQGVTKWGGAVGTSLLDAYIADGAGSFQGDVWSELLEPILDEVLNTPSELSDKTSAAALAAFDRINLGKALPPAGVVIAGISAGDDIFGKSVAAPVLQALWDTWSGGNGQGDLWTGLMQVMSIFGCKYVTAIEEDAILPITFGLGGSSPWRTINPDEYTTIGYDSEFDEKFYSYITNVLLFSSAFQSSQWQASTPRARAIGQASVNTAAADQGRLYTLEAPAWLNPFGSPAAISIIPGGTVPDASSPEAVAVQQEQGKLEQAYFLSEIGDDYAETVLYDQIFAHRKMNIAGRVRFDIAPGSLLKVVTPGERFTGESSNLWAHAVNVTVVVSSDDSQAYTAIELYNVRTDLEQQSLTTPKHPLFDDAWLGGKLSAEA